MARSPTAAWADFNRAQISRSLPVRDGAGRPRGLTDAQNAQIYEARQQEYQAIRKQATAGGKSSVRASVLLMSACQDNQLAGDGQDNGEFTGTLLMVWDKGRFEGGYTAFHQAILDEMPSDQTPCLLRQGPVDEAFEALLPFTVYAGQKGPFGQ